MQNSFDEPKKSPAKSKPAPKIIKFSQFLKNVNKKYQNLSKKYIKIHHNKQFSHEMLNF